MKKLTFLLAIGAMGFTVVMASCGSGTQQKSQKTESTVQNEQQTTQTADPQQKDEMAAQLARGEQIYKEKCIACHQANGQGIPNAFPTLVGSDFLLNHKVLAVSQVLNGSDHVKYERKVNFPTPMPPQVDTKEDAVAVINYVLNNFGNKGGYVTLDDVKDVEILPRQ